MKPGTIPTSFLQRSKIKANALNNNSGHFFVVLTAIICAIIAAICSSIFIQFYPITWLINFSNDAKVIYVNKDQESSSTQLADLIKTKAGSLVVTLYSANIDDYNTAVPLGQGVLISTDGWLVTLQKNLTVQNSVTVLLSDGRLFVSNKIVRDDYNNAAYVKITANDLPAVNFTANAPALGELAMWYIPASTNGETILFGHLNNLQYSENNIFSSRHNNLLYLTDIPETKLMYPGAPVFNQVGDLIGLTFELNTILPVNSISSKVYDLFASNELKRTNINFEYTLLARSINSDTNQQTGARVTAIHSGVELLQVDDVITSINNISIDAQHDLAEVLAGITEATATVNLQRSGKNVTVALPID
ncbi:MAG: S1C family serine protease [Patescibacteria group bacterium]|jgi:S1-C subfamily serine protease